MRSFFVSPIALVTAALLSGAARADQWVLPTTKTHQSENKAHQCKVVPNEKNSFGGPATATLSTVAEGKAKDVWQKTLVNQPYRVYVSDSRPQIVTVDTYGNLGFKHALVVYDQAGKMLADYALEDVLTPEELGKVRRTELSRHWAGKTTFNFSADGKEFVLRLELGRMVRVELGTGKFTR